MQKNSGNKWNKQICKWIASFLTAALLVNQSSFSAMADEYEEYEYIEDVTDTVINVEDDNSDTNEYVSVDEDESINEEEFIEFGAEDIASTASVGDTFSDGKLIYKIINDDADNLQVEVSKYEEWNENGEYVSGTLDIPSVVTNGTDEYKVISIGDSAFYYSPFTNITIPDSVIRIGENAFRQNLNLTSMVIPENVTSIGGYAFADCSVLSNITLPNSVTSIGKCAFNYCINLTDIIIPENITRIEYGTFLQCKKLNNITIPSNVTSIGDCAFNLCDSLTDITIPNSVTSIGNNTFSHCYLLTNITIPNSVTSIGGEAFCGCSNLKSITIPDGVTSIEYGIFRDCYSLTNITIPDSITEIRWGAFSNCRSLENITIPDNISSIEGSTFSGCRNLTSITIPNNINSLGHEAFKSCNRLTNVTILNNNISIDWDAFMGCTQLKSLQIALSENTTATPAILWDNCFSQCPDDRYLTFLTADGTTELSDSTTPTLAEAVKVYNAVDDGGINDGYWYGWKLPEVNEVPDNEETFTITASAGTGGSVTPNGAVKVKTGDSQQFTISPKDGYRVSSILADGNEVLNSEQVTYYSETESSNAGNTKAGSRTEYYVFENVTGNHTLAAYFEPTSTGDNNSPDDSDDNNGPDDSGDNDTGDNNVPDGSGGDDTVDNNDIEVSSGDDPGSNNANDISIPAVISDTNVMNNTDTISYNNPIPVSKDNEPKTGDSSYMEVYATIAMIAGLSYLLLYFADGKNGMTEEEKKEIVSALVKWAKKGKRLRKYAALAIIFLVLVYYHSIGKRTAEEWKAVYEK